MLRRDHRIVDNQVVREFAANQQRSILQRKDRVTQGTANRGKSWVHRYDGPEIPAFSKYGQVGCVVYPDLKLRATGSCDGG